MIREGDSILHKPTGEEWAVAGVYPNGDIVCAGWPCSIAPAADIELVESCTDEEHENMIRRCSEIHGYDPRKSLALEKLRLRGSVK